MSWRCARSRRDDFRCPVLRLAQRASQDLANLSLRQLADELVFRGNLVIDEVLPAVSLQLGRGRSAVSAEHDEGLHHLSAHPVGDAYDADLAHGGMRR